jgi:hypothetical protein
MNWLNWKPDKIERQKPDIKLVCQKVETEKIQTVNLSRIDYKMIRKAFTIGIEAEYFLSALNPKEGTYFGLKIEPTHSTKERLVNFGETIGEALDKNKSFTFQCVNRKERNEIAIIAATMLTNGWTIKLDNMTVMGEPVREQKVLPEQ